MSRTRSRTFQAAVALGVAGTLAFAYQWTDSTPTTQADSGSRYDETPDSTGRPGQDTGTADRGPDRDRPVPGAPSATPEQVPADAEGAPSEDRQETLAGGGPPPVDAGGGPPPPVDAPSRPGYRATPAGKPAASPSGDRDRPASGDRDGKEKDPATGAGGPGTTDSDSGQDDDPPQEDEGLLTVTVDKVVDQVVGSVSALGGLLG